MDNKLHPTVREFKEFLTKHPALIKEVRENGRSWQEHYEKWVLLGEDDPYWKQYEEAEDDTEKDDTENEKGTKKQSEMFGQLMKLTENIDINKVQEHVQQFSSTITTIQGMLGQFQETKNKKELPDNTRNEKQPFNWFRD